MNNAAVVSAAPEHAGGLKLLGPEPSSAFERLLGRHRYTRPAGRILKLEGDPAPMVYFISSGWVALSKSMEEGHRQIIDIVLPGELIDPGSADADTSAVQIEALSDVAFSAIPVEAWGRLVNAEPEIRGAMDRVYAAALSRLSERILRLGKGSAETRIAYSLLELCVRMQALGQVAGREFHIPMTQAQLGDFTGLSSVHVCRTLRRLARNGILTAEDHMDIRIRDFDRLSEIAETDLDTLRNEIIPAA